jgi:hypothetical protein
VLRRILIALWLGLVGLRWIWDHHAWSGGVVLRLTQGHGVRANDWVSLALWLLALVVLFRQPDRLSVDDLVQVLAEPVADSAVCHLPARHPL